MDVKDRMRVLGLEITRGWKIYGTYMDAGKQGLPEAQAVKNIIDKLTKERAELELENIGEAAIDYVAEHDGRRP